ncbi:MAG: hypothetical protein MUE34_05085 [Acidimicrobiales bacterium]|nr:hypothetical protein [Acidimicrobiales bacterium]
MSWTLQDIDIPAADRGCVAASRWMTRAERAVGRLYEQLDLGEELHGWSGDGDG